MFNLPFISTIFRILMSYIKRTDHMLQHCLNCLYHYFLNISARAFKFWSAVQQSAVTSWKIPGWRKSTNVMRFGRSRSRLRYKKYIICGLLPLACMIYIVKSIWNKRTINRMRYIICILVYCSFGNIHFAKFMYY
jgi:hypothetical protein